MQPAGQWVEVQEGPGLRWFDGDVGGGWRFNHWYGKIWKEEGGWRWVQDGPCWKYHVSHTGKRKREDPPLPMGESLLEAAMTQAVGIGEPPNPQPAVKRQRVRLITYRERTERIYRWLCWCAVKVCAKGPNDTKLR